MTDMKHMVYILKKILQFFFFFSNQSIFLLHLAPIRCFQNGSCLLLGNEGSMQGQQSRQGTQWNPCGINAGKHYIEPEQEIPRKKSMLIHLISLLEWAKGVTFIYLFSYIYNPAKT